MTTILLQTPAHILAAAEGTNVLYDAGINTLLGMGMAFAVLILISLLISLFPLINKVLSGESKPAPAPVPAPVKAPVAEESVDVTDDLELYAVIAAAIAAYEEGSSTDGFVVRSIRKRRIGAR